MFTQELDMKEIDAHSAPVIDRELIKMARMGLGWTVKDLAERCNLGIATIRRAEAAGAAGVTEGSMLVIERAFREAGVVFFEENDGGRGLRLPRRRR
jgi:transcriptional regulator with XRE-family HTH domain